MEQIESLRTTAGTVADAQNQYYIKRFSDALASLTERLRAYIPDDAVDKYIGAIRDLEDNGASISIEAKLPYSIKQNIPQVSESLQYNPYIPDVMSLNTAYIRPYVVTIALIGVIATGWIHWERMLP